MYNVITEFNKRNADAQSLIGKALTSASGVGGALSAEALEKIMTNTIIRLSPEIALIDPVGISSKTYEFNRKTTAPAPGGAQGESATTQTTNSKYVRSTVDTKVVKRKGKVTGYLQDAAREYIDAVAQEMESNIEAHIWDLIEQFLYGNKDVVTIVNSVAEQTPNVEFDGLDKIIATNRINQARGGVVPTDLSLLDTMIDQSNRNGGSRHKRAFGMTPEMLSKYSSLLTNVRLNQGLIGNGMTQVDIAGGWRLNAYRDIPIIETTSLAPVEQMRPTITLAAVATGGSLSDGTYYVQMAPITQFGEQEASAEQSVTLSAGTAVQRISISLNTYHTDASSNRNTYAYKIYVSTTSGAEKLNKIVPAFKYDAELAMAGDNGVSTDYIYISSLTPGSDVPTHMRNDVPYVATGGIYPETIYLWDFDPIQGLGRVPYTNRSGDRFKGLVVTEPLAKVDDYNHFLIKSYTAIADAFEKTSVWVRGVRRV